jgi:acyl-coenzyme A synthetase/AMP-(fatty) acid ligase
MDAEDPLFILYTSGSTGKPKGVLHTTGGYMVYTSLTHEAIFDIREEDTYWCTADIGWVTGHSYIVYGPLANGATSVMFEGVPQYPDWGRFWDVVDKHQINIIYTAPTALRALMREGDEPVKKRSRKSLRLLGTVGEPINPEVWLWYHRVVGDGRCPIVDTWWQTETGGILITPLPGAIPQKPGSATLPFFGVEPTVVDDQGKVLEGPCSGNLCISRAWPGIMRGVFGDPERFRKTYFTTFPGRYFTGDGCRRDADGYYWITGRVDDVINVSGHRLGTAEVESALVSHHSVAEAAVVGFPHDIKGAGHLRIRDAQAGRRAQRRAAHGADPARAQGDWTAGAARRDPLGAGAAQDALGQDHAPHPPQDRGRRVRGARRHLHARRPHRGGHAGQGEESARREVEPHRPGSSAPEACRRWDRPELVPGRLSRAPPESGQRTRPSRATCAGSRCPG